MAQLTQQQMESAVDVRYMGDMANDLLSPEELATGQQVLAQYAMHERVLPNLAATEQEDTKNNPSYVYQDNLNRYCLVTFRPR